VHWRQKCAVQKVFGSTAIGASAYRFVTSELLKTRTGEPRKWCFWFREHALLISRHLKIAPLRGTVWCIDPGVTHTSVLLLKLSADRVILTNKLGPLSRTYLRGSVSMIEAKLPAIARSLKIDLADARHRLSLAAADIAENRASWLVDHGRELERALTQPSGSVDSILSMGALEHYSKADLAELLPQMKRLLPENGAMSHIIDLRDHFHHADSGLHPLNHLRYSERKWKSMTSPISYTNQMRRSGYLELFRRSGFEIAYSGFDPHGDYPPLGEEICVEHRTDDPIDDEARVIHIVAAPAQSMPGGR
jgi:hypothetical protein